MNELKIFQNQEFGQVRVIEQNGEPWFVGKDIADVLGYQNSSKALSDHVDGEDKLNNESLSSLGQRGGWLINESGLYSLILSSKLPTAKQFKRWVTSEVLPSIRQHGIYAVDELLDNPDLAIKAFSALKLEREKRIKAEQQLEKDKPKVLFADAVSVSNDSILIRELAKLICQNGFQIGEKRLFDWLRENRFLIKKKGKDYNLPTQKALNLKLFEIKETVISHSNSIKTHRTPYVTGKGQLYFINKIVGNQEVAL